MKPLIFFIAISLFLATDLLIVNAQVKIPLTLDESSKSFVKRTLFCDKDYNCGLNRDENSKISSLENDGILVKVLRKGKDFYLVFDSNGNNKLSDEKKIVLTDNSSVIIKINKKSQFNGIQTLPFEISHKTKEMKGSITDNFVLSAHYGLSGTLNYKNCSAKVLLSDNNYDGEFDLSDSKSGTNFQIDKNNDNKFWGREEFRQTYEIIEFCGQNFLVSSLTNSLLTLNLTDRQIAKIGETVPDFSFVLLGGEKLSSENLRGEIYVLDFWASWCVPCVKNLPQINILKKEYENKVLFYSINVDEASRKNSAVKIIEEKRMIEFSAVRELGNNDPFWQTFGGVDSNSLKIPLYILIDKNGKLIYADYGGSDLVDLKSSIEKLLSNQE